MRVFNQLVDSLGLTESMVESVLARAIGAMRRRRFLRMKRSVSLLVSDRQAPGRGAIVEGTYRVQSWCNGTAARANRVPLDVALTALHLKVTPRGFRL